MALLITVFTAVIATEKWYTGKEISMKYGTLSFLFWGASIMWLVDALFEYAELKAAHFTPALEEMLNDAFLGLSVVALALVIWLIVLLIKDPRGTVRSVLKGKAQ